MWAGPKGLADRIPAIVADHSPLASPRGDLSEKGVYPRGRTAWPVRRTAAPAASRLTAATAAKRQLRSRAARRAQAKKPARRGNSMTLSQPTLTTSLSTSPTPPHLPLSGPSGLSCPAAAQTAGQDSREPRDERRRRSAAAPLRPPGAAWYSRYEGQMEPLGAKGEAGVNPARSRHCDRRRRVASRDARHGSQSTYRRGSSSPRRGQSPSRSTRGAVPVRLGEPGRGACHALHHLAVNNGSEPEGAPPCTTYPPLPTPSCV